MGIFPETTVGKHNPPCHLQMPTKALSCKKKAICEYGPEAPSWNPGGCCTLMVDEEIPSDNVESFKCLEKAEQRYINVINYYCYYIHTYIYIYICKINLCFQIINHD